MDITPSVREQARARLIADLDTMRPVLENVIATGSEREARRARRTLLRSERLRARISGDYDRLAAVRNELRQQAAQEATSDRGGDV